MQNLGERHTGYATARRTPMAVWYILAAFVGALLGIVFLVVAYPEALSTLGGGTGGRERELGANVYT